jgi:predicted PurR-regulated permease PerM
MSASATDSQKPDLSYAAAVIAFAIGMIAVAALAYLLLDILLILFLGIVVAAALQPAHVWLSQWGVPKGLAILCIYLFFLVAIGLLAVFVGPPLFQQIGSFAADIPERYASLVTQLQSSATPLLQRLGAILPPLDKLTQHLTSLSPDFFQNFLTFMTSTVSFFTYFVVVLALGFYWTMEVPHLERLVLSLLPVARRPAVLAIWREIEYKLGAFVRAQGLAMLIIGVASALGYFFIGLPNVLVLAVFAGLLEIIPLMGPIVTAMLAALVALPQGWAAVLLVVGFATVLQQFESNVLIPRIMSRTVGISDLAGLFAIIAFGALYGVLGVFVAIPLTVVIQVLLQHMVISPEPTPEPAAVAPHPLAALQSRVQALRQQLRLRLRERSTRLGRNADTADHVADVLDQRIEQAIERVETILATARSDTELITPEEHETIARAVQQAALAIEQAVNQINATMPPAPSEEQAQQTEIAAPVVEQLQRKTRQIERAVQRAAEVLTEAQENDEVPQKPRAEEQSGGRPQP